VVCQNIRQEIIIIHRHCGLSGPRIYLCCTRPYYLAVLCASMLSRSHAEFHSGNILLNQLPSRAHNVIKRPQTHFTTCECAYLRMTTWSSAKPLELYVAFRPHHIMQYYETAIIYYEKFHDRLLPSQYDKLVSNLATLTISGNSLR